MTIKKPCLILASSSLYRKQLLQRLQLEFETAIPDIDETAKTGESASTLVRRLSLEKAKAVAETRNNVIVIGSDQVAACGDLMLGKPGDLTTAVAQLKLVSGRTLVFHTGLTVIDSNSGKIQTDEVTTTVEFKPLSDDIIQAYLQKEPALNCAGSFKSEGLGIALTQRITEDDPTALIGLPLIRLTQMLENIHYPVI